jgi:hypothetical protein
LFPPTATQDPNTQITNFFCTFSGFHSFIPLLLLIPSFFFFFCGAN